MTEVRNIRPAAAVFVPSHRTGWWGGPDKRLRCIRDDKVVFADEATAEHRAASIRQREPTMQAYKGRCGHWHVGHSRRKRR